MNEHPITFDNDKNFGLVDFRKITQEGTARMAKMRGVEGRHPHQSRALLPWGQYNLLY